MNQKLKKIMILSGTYIVLMTVLLIGVSTAKYTESTVAYSSFGTAGYNVILLGGEDAAGNVQQFGRTLLAGDLLPGMKYTGISDTSTAKVFPFKVANGTSEEDVSEIAQNYTVKLRTTRNIPLDFKLLLGATVFNASGPVALDKNGRPVTNGTPELDANGIAWYEWTFKDIGNDGTGTVELDSAPVFSLTAGEVRSNEHALVVEWPVTVGENGVPNGNSDEYMKEIELLEVRILSAQQNNTTQMPSEEEEEPDVREYSKGFILLDPEKEVQTYEVDYRAFRKTVGAEIYTYDFIVNNGVGLGVTQPDDSVRYKVSINAPMMWKGEEGAGSMNYLYSLEKEIRSEEEPYGTGVNETLGRFPQKVFLVNLDDGTRVEVDQEVDYREDLVARSADSSNERYFKEIRYCEPETEISSEEVSTEEMIFELENTEVQGDVSVPVSREDHFRLTLSWPGQTALPAYLQLNGRIRIVIEKVE